MKNAIIISSVVVALVVGLAGGYFWGSTVATASYAPKIAAVNKLFPTAPTSTLSLGGRVDSIAGSVITLAASAPSENPFFTNDFLVMRQVTITSATKITKAVPKEQTELQQEIQAYLKQTIAAPAVATSVPVAPPASVVPPSPVTETNISLSDIKIGDIITVTAASDILNIPNFTATAVQDQPLVLSQTAGSGK